MDPDSDNSEENINFDDATDIESSDWDNDIEVLEVESTKIPCTLDGTFFKIKI